MNNFKKLSIAFDRIWIVKYLGGIYEKISIKKENQDLRNYDFMHKYFAVISKNQKLSFD